MTVTDEIKRRIELKGQLIEITKGEIEALEELLREREVKEGEAA